MLPSQALLDFLCERFPTISDWRLFTRNVWPEAWKHNHLGSTVFTCVETDVQRLAARGCLPVPFLDVVIQMRPLFRREVADFWEQRPKPAPFRRHPRRQHQRYR